MPQLASQDPPDRGVGHVPLAAPAASASTNAVTMTATCAVQAAPAPLLLAPFAELAARFGG
jgi:hypothetical protein